MHYFPNLALEPLSEEKTTGRTFVLRTIIGSLSFITALGACLVHKFGV
tara:strand:+ start:2138 stop:2281 length:144 start_codon:yes stop_codon:yes gene_type:complete